MRTLVTLVFLVVCVSTWLSQAQLAEGKPTCLFLHGKGVKGDFGYYEHFNSYWGSQMSEEFLDTCDPTFVKTDTSSRGWDDMELIKEYCGAIKKWRPIAIFTHSMGNLIVAAGIHHEVEGCADLIMKADECTPGKTLWFGVQGPWRGSPVADKCDKEICRFTWTDLLSAPYAAYKSAMRLGCGCSSSGATGATKTLASKFAMKASKSAKKLAFYCRRRDRNCVELVAYHEKYMYGNLCGLTPETVNPDKSKSTERYGLPVLTKLVGKDWGVDEKLDYTKRRGTDGLVAMQSCRGLKEATKYGESFDDPFYALLGSHADGTGRNNDAPGQPPKKSPSSWFRKMAEVAKNRLASCPGQAPHQVEDLPSRKNSVDNSAYDDEDVYN